MSVEFLVVQYYGHYDWVCVLNGKLSAESVNSTVFCHCVGMGLALRQLYGTSSEVFFCLTTHLRFASLVLERSLSLLCGVRLKSGGPEEIFLFDRIAPPRSPVGECKLVGFLPSEERCRDETGSSRLFVHFLLGLLC